MRPWLAERAARDPHAVALIAGGDHLTYGELARRADAVARRLAGLGLSAGDRVATVLDASAPAVALVHGVQRLGATLVPLNPRLAPPEIEQLVALVRPAIVVTRDDALDDARPADDARLCDELPTDEPHSIVFTSGSSGAPKGVVLTHANHAASARGACARLRVGARDRWLLCMPLCHVGGLSITVRAVQVGAAVVVERGFDPEALVRSVRDSGVTVVSLVARMLSRVLDRVEAGGDAAALRSLRCVLVGGGPLPAAVLERARAVGLPIAQTYGLTEAASMVTCAEPGAATEPGSVGAPIAGIDVAIADPGRDGIGEIVVRGPTVAAGYVGGAGTVREGWLHSGDLGCLADDGSLHVVGRRTDLVVTGGENVHPSEVEAVLLAHPAVVDAAVYGIADDSWGQRVEAKVVFRGAPLDPTALASWCGVRLAAFKVPKAFHAVRELPRTATGKVARGALA